MQDSNYRVLGSNFRQSARAQDRPECHITQHSRAHWPFGGGCAQQKRILRCLWQVSRAHFGENRRQADVFDEDARTVLELMDEHRQSDGAIPEDDGADGR